MIGIMPLKPEGLKLCNYNWAFIVRPCQRVLIVARHTPAFHPVPNVSHSGSQGTTLALAMCKAFPEARRAIWHQPPPFTSVTNTFCLTQSYPEAKATLFQLTENWCCFVNLGTIHPLAWFRILCLVSLEAWTLVSRVTGSRMNLPSVSATNLFLRTKFHLEEWGLQLVKGQSPFSHHSHIFERYQKLTC